MTPSQAFNVADCARRRFCVCYLDDTDLYVREGESYELIRSLWRTLQDRAIRDGAAS